MKRLRKIMAEEGLLKAGGQWGSYAFVQNGVWEDTIVTSPNGDSVLVGGRETYPTDVPSQAGHVATKMLGGRVPDMPRPLAQKLVSKIEEAEQRHGNMDYVEVSVKYDPSQGWSYFDGRWIS